MSLPNLLIIGAMKTGTTSLHHYLNLHPEIFMSETKELDYFIEDMNWTRGQKWYAGQFPEHTKIRGESSPRYTLFPAHDGVPQRIHSAIPEVRLLYLVRDPVERIVSHYMHDVIEGKEQRPLQHILECEPDNHYVLASRYWLQLSQYRSCFRDDQILIVQQKDLRHNRAATLRSVFRFLGVNQDFRSLRIEIERHRTNRKRRLTRAGQHLKDGAVARVLKLTPKSMRGYLEWLALFPFSRAVERYSPDVRLRSHLKALLAEELDKVLSTMPVALQAFVD